MNAKEWLAAKNPYPMFDYLGRTVTPRKLRLFGIACCRRIWDLMTDEECRKAVILAERLVEGAGSLKEAARLRNRLKNEYLALNERMDSEDKVSQVRLWCIGAAKNVLQTDDAYLRDVGIRAGDADLFRVWQPTSSAVGHHYVERVGNPPPDELYEEYQSQCDLLREVLGNPFRPVTLDKSWLTSDVLSLTKGIYEEKAFDRMPILADALQDAGCGIKDVLNHLCDHKAKHVRGCWALDLVLGKK